MIDQRGFAGIGAADDGDANRALRQILIGFDNIVIVELLAFLDRLRHHDAQRVVEVAEALAMFGRNLDRLA